MRTLFLVPLVAAFGCSTTYTMPPSATVARQTVTPQTKESPNIAAQGPTIVGEKLANVQTVVCAPVRVHFATDSAEIDPGDKNLLKLSAQCLKTHQALRVTVAGNTDERGTQEYNLALGERRARSVALFLESEGVTPAQLQTVSFGKDRPLCSASDEACWERNRRASITPACRM
jgi:peptidoglycan-associated lipoprotein